MPWITLDVGVVEHPKLIGLPSHAARWGWIVLLVAGKRQRISGTFAGRRHAQAVLGEFRRYLDLYIAVGLIDEGPGDTLTIHDWASYQRDPTGAARQQRYRDRYGPVTRNGDVTVSVTDSVTALARAPAVSLPLSKRALPNGDELGGVRGVGEGEPGAEPLPDGFGPPGWSDLCRLMEQLTGRAYALRDPASGIGVHASDHLRRRGSAAVEAAYRRAASRAGSGAAPRQIVFGADDFLDPIPRGQVEPTFEEQLAVSKRKTRARQEREARP